MLEENPALRDVRDAHGASLLHIACKASPERCGVTESEQVRVVEFLLGLGLPIDEPLGRDAVTPLFIAVASPRNGKLIDLLIDRGAKVSAAPGGGLFAAAWWDDVKNLERLIRAGAKVDVVVGITPFLAAWLWKKFACAKLLAAHGADVSFQDRKGKTALHHGVEQSYDPALLRWLLRSGASPDIHDRDGISPRARAQRKRDQRYRAVFGTNQQRVKRRVGSPPNMS
jgi:ankyrin repeat protein